MREPQGKNRKGVRSVTINCAAFLWRPVMLSCVLLVLVATPGNGAQAGQSEQSSRAPSTGQQPPAPGRQVQDASARSPEDDYVIGPEDVLAVSVWKEPDISRILPVRPDGRISLPLVGELQASGLTASKLQDIIAQKLKDYIENPQVNVIVQEVRSRSFNVVGKVLKPGSFDLAKPTAVLDAIALAGGLQDFAKVSKIYVLRRMPDGSQRMIPFNYKLVIKGKRLDENVELQSGDTVVVP